MVKPKVNVQMDNACGITGLLYFSSHTFQLMELINVASIRFIRRFIFSRSNKYFQTNVRRICMKNVAE